MYQSTIPCPKCGTQNLRGQWVCAQCGNTLVAYCPSCHTGNAIDSQYCHACHAVLPHAGAPVVQPPYQPQQPPQQQYPQYPPAGYQDQGQYPPQYQQPYAQQGYQPQAQQPPYQDYQGSYDQYGDYKPYPVHGGGAAPVGVLDGLTARLKEIVQNTNPILLSALVVLVVGMGIFFVLAFQFGWIKTGPAPKAAAPKDTQAPVISMLRVKEGANSGAIITWVTNELSSTQLEYGIWPYANTTTLIESDPRTGVNAGTLTHSVGLTNLLPRTSYVYRAVSYDKDGNKGVSPDMQFDTSVGGGSSSTQQNTQTPTQSVYDGGN